MPSSLHERVDAVIDAAISEKRIVGTVTLIAKDGETIYRRAAGFAESAQWIDENARFALTRFTV